MILFIGRLIAAVETIEIPFSLSMESISQKNEMIDRLFFRFFQTGQVRDEGSATASARATRLPSASAELGGKNK